MKKLINLKVFKKMLNKKENISLKTFQNSTKSKKETVLDNDLINAIDIPFIVLKDNKWIE